jgi:hypothetical protein
MATKKDVATQDTTTQVVVLTDAQKALVAQMAEDTGSGFEEATSDSYAIPFVYILQSGSPQCKKSDGAYIPEAEEGMLINSVSLELYDGEVGLNVVPVLFQQRFIAWGLREKGGGFKGEYLPSDPIVARTHKDPDPTKARDIMDDFPDQQLVDTRIHYCLLKTANGYQPILITFSSTQVKKSKQWMSRMQNIQMFNPTAQRMAPAPMASRIWNITTTPEANDQGSWFGFKIGECTEHLDPSLYAQAMEFRKAITSGVAKAQHVDPSAVGGEKEIPF